MARRCLRDGRGPWRRPGCLKLLDSLCGRRLQVSLETRRVRWDIRPASIAASLGVEGRPGAGSHEVPNQNRKFRVVTQRISTEVRDLPPRTYDWSRAFLQENTD